MELDFQSVKALASPTRIDILKESMEREATPTGLADELDRSKSTISSHLDKLTDAGLLEKESKDGRKRVIYRPTDKAEAITSGKERKVRFSLAGTGMSAIAGTVLVSRYFTTQGSQRTSDAGTMTVQGAEATAEASSAAPSGEIFLLAGIGFLSIAAASLLYGLAMNKMGAEK